MNKTFLSQILRRIPIIILLILILNPGYGQTKNLRLKDKGFQISFVPGISTNGVFSGIYFNKVSINLFGGYSAGSTRLEIGGISNLNSFYSNGIQIAGVANAVGSNTFVNLTLMEERSLISEGLESNFTGIQIAGLVNYVRDNSSGIQITGGINVANGHGSGFQLAGVSNMVGEYYEGVQLATPAI